ncbi:MAG: tetratricopeptide repeat protein [Geobacteraceae bacterium]|nr:tetratricopeptide repeat protein [Geobacteraceae bacterium]
MKNNIVSALVLAFLLCGGCAAMEESHNKATYHYQMGQSYLAERNYTKALVELTEAEKLMPDDPDLLNRLGLAYYFKGKYELAEQKYLKALELRPVFSDARNNLGVNYLEMRRWDDAIKQFNTVTDDLFFQNHDDACMNLALAYHGKGDNATALTMLRPVVARNPKNAAAHLNLGRIYNADERVDLAIAEFKKAVELNRDYATAHYYLGLAYLKQKNISLALKAFNEVVRIVPDAEIGQLSKEYVDMLK